MKNLKETKKQKVKEEILNEKVAGLKAECKKWKNAFKLKSKISKRLEAEIQELIKRLPKQTLDENNNKELFESYKKQIQYLEQKLENKEEKDSHYEDIIDFIKCKKPYKVYNSIDEIMNIAVLNDDYFIFEEHVRIVRGFISSIKLLMINDIEQNNEVA